MQQEWVDRNFLASTHVGTPDPRQEHPPEGQRLIVAWDFPRSLFQRELQLVITVLLWDQTQKIIVLPVERKRDAAAYFFPNPGLNKSGKSILTYRVQAVDKEGNLVSAWEHHLWTEWIDIDCSAAHKSNDSVSSQPKQESVIETP